MIRRIKSTFGLLLTAISLVSCVIVAALWCRSFWYFDQVNYQDASPGVARCRMVQIVLSIRGVHTSWNGWNSVVPKGYSNSTVTRPSWFDRWNWVAASGRMSTGWPGLLGFYWRDFPKQVPNARQVDVGVPWWGLLLGASVFPSVRAITWVRRLRRARRRSAGLCLACGYDMRETPTHCPECGTVRVAGEAKRSVVVID